MFCIYLLYIDISIHWFIYLLFIIYLYCWHVIPTSVHGLNMFESHYDKNSLQLPASATAILTALAGSQQSCQCPRHCRPQPWPKKTDAADGELICRFLKLWMLWRRLGKIWDDDGDDDHWWSILIISFFRQTRWISLHWRRSNKLAKQKHHEGVHVPCNGDLDISRQHIRCATMTIPIATRRSK